jgi:hypothetical protein
MARTIPLSDRYRLQAPCSVDDHRKNEHPTRSPGESHFFAANVYHPPPKGYLQDALFAASRVERHGVNKVELLPVNKVVPSDQPE